MKKLQMNTRTLLSSLPCIAALGLMMPVAPIHAEEYEYESGEGVHEEEWYDPSDWFDDQSNADSDRIDYESDDWNTSDDWGYDYDYDWNTDTSGDDYVYDATDENTSVYDSDAYYDGYYDGYYDNSYGYDYWDNSWGTTYSSTFTDGYYDGYYDQNENFYYEPYYYISTGATDRNMKTNQQRSGDKSRERGDRMSSNKSQSKNQKQGQNQQEQTRAQQQKTMPQSNGMVRRRGTVQSMTQKNPSQVSDDHTVLQIQFNGGDKVLVDLGPKMTQQQLPFSQGDRVTLRGNRMERDGQSSILMVQRISTGEEQINLRPESKQGSQHTSARQNNRQNQGNNNSSQNNRWSQDNTNRGQRNAQQNQGSDNQNSDSNNQGKQVSMQGEIASVNKLQTDNQDLTLYRVTLDDSRQCTVALDRQFDEKQMNRAEGKDITIKGRRTMIDGKSVIKVSSIQIDGQPLQQTRK